MTAAAEIFSKRGRPPYADGRSVSVREPASFPRSKSTLRAHGEVTFFLAFAVPHEHLRLVMSLALSGCVR